MRSRFTLTGLLTSVVNFVLHALTYYLVLKEFFAAHPAGSKELQQQLVKDGDQMVIWALVLSALAFGFLITAVVHWSRATSWTSGLRTGAITGSLLWGGVNLGLYASSNNFSLAATFADLVSSAACVTLSSAFAAWLLHMRRSQSEASMRGDVTAKLRAT